MRDLRVLSLAVLCAVVLAAGCGAQRSAGSGATHSAAPAPRDADLSPVVERFYQQVEGAHWTAAYGMLTERLRGTLTRDQFVQRYRDFADADVSARQTGDRTIVAHVSVPVRTGQVAMSSPKGAPGVTETLRLVWDGEGWLIDAIDRGAAAP